MKNKIIIYLLIIVGSYTIFSCEDYLEKYPLDEPTDLTFWSNESELNMAITSAYNSTMYFNDRKVGAPIRKPWYLLLSTATDEAWDRHLGPWQLLTHGAITPSDVDAIYNTWKNAYETIGKCNRILKYMHRAEDDTRPHIYERIEAEARFLRAYWYQLLINLYGDVPFVTEPISIHEAQLPREDKSIIYNFVLSELDAVANILPESYTGSDVGRITKGAALALKARVALFNDDWSVAATTSKRIIDMGIYELFPDYKNLFGYEGENSSEGILTIYFNREFGLTHGTPQHLMGRLPGGWNNKVPPQSIVDSYECIDGLRIDESPLYDASDPFTNRDPRLHATIVVPGSMYRGYLFENHPDSLLAWDYTVEPPRRVENTEVTNPYASFSGYQFRKYSFDDPREFRGQSELNIMMIRYAEVLLIYAESKVEMGQIDVSVYSAINLVRQRAGMPDINPGKSQDELRKIIRQERKVEFVLEGLRFFDIRRWKIAEDVMQGSLYGRPLREYESDFIPTFDDNGTPHYDAYADKLRMFDTRSFNPARDYLWPIPQRELDINPNLSQNPGY